MKGDRLYVLHILDCIHRIQRYCDGGAQVFFSSELIQDAILRNLQVLGESTQRISDQLKAQHAEVDWRSIAGFRNVLVHDYLGINLERVWEIVSVHLQVLEPQIEAMRRAVDAIE